MAKSFQNIAPATKIADTQEAQFSKRVLENAQNAQDSIALNVGALYVNPIKQLFHGEINRRGRLSNRLFVFEISAEGIRPMVISHAMLAGMFICKASDLTGEITVEERTDEAGNVYHRPTGFSYVQVTKNGNLNFEPVGNSLAAKPFVLRCYDYVDTVQAQYETDDEMVKNNHTTRELKMTEEGFADVITRGSYLLEKVDKATIEEAMAQLPTTEAELAAYYKSVGQSNEYEKNIKPWLL